MIDGSSIPLQAGDYLIKLKFRDFYSELKDNHLFKDKDGIFFPGSMIRMMQPGQRFESRDQYRPVEHFTLRYKDELIRITLLKFGLPIFNYCLSSECPTFRSLIIQTEHLLYVKQNGYSAKPVPLKSLSEAPSSKGKRYEHPSQVKRKKQEQAESELVKIQFLELCRFKEQFLKYRFSAETGQFILDDTTDLSTILKLPGIVPWERFEEGIAIEFPK